MSISKTSSKELTLCVSHYLYDGIDGYEYAEPDMNSTQYVLIDYSLNAWNHKYQLSDYEYNYQNLSHKYKLVEDYRLSYHRYAAELYIQVGRLSLRLLIFIG